MTTTVLASESPRPEPVKRCAEALGAIPAVQEWLACTLADAVDAERVRAERERVFCERQAAGRN